MLSVQWRSQQHGRPLCFPRQQRLHPSKQAWSYSWDSRPTSSSEEMGREEHQENHRFSSPCTTNALCASLSRCRHPDACPLPTRALAAGDIGARATKASLAHALCHAAPAGPQPPSRSVMASLWAPSSCHALAGSGWEQHYPPPGHMVPHGRGHKLFLNLQGEVTHTTKVFCSFPEGSPPPDNPKSKGCPAKGRLLQTLCVQTKSCWDPGKLENLVPRVRDEAPRVGAEHPLDAGVHSPPQPHPGGCVVGVGQADPVDMLERMGKLPDFVLEGKQGKPPASLLGDPGTMGTLNPGILAAVGCSPWS